jgi:hypothetical protein
MIEIYMALVVLVTIGLIFAFWVKPDGHNPK